MAKDGGALAAPKCEVASIYPTMQELRAAATKQADTCVAGVAWCGICRVDGGAPPLVRRHSYRGHRVGLWRIANWLNAETTKDS